jgi:hypothetical protein
LATPEERKAEVGKAAEIDRPKEKDRESFPIVSTQEDKSKRTRAIAAENAVLAF